MNLQKVYEWMDDNVKGSIMDLFHEWEAKAKANAIMLTPESWRKWGGRERRRRGRGRERQRRGTIFISQDQPGFNFNLGSDSVFVIWHYSTWGNSSGEVLFNQINAYDFRWIMINGLLQYQRLHTSLIYQLQNSGKKLYKTAYPFNNINEKIFHFRGL